MKAKSKHSDFFNYMDSDYYKVKRKEAREQFKKNHMEPKKPVQLKEFIKQLKKLQKDGWELSGKVSYELHNEIIELPKDFEHIRDSGEYKTFTPGSSECNFNFKIYKSRKTTK